MKGDAAKGQPSLRLRQALSLAAIAVLTGFLGNVLVNTASAALIPPEEHWKYSKRWAWDGESRRTIGIITPTIVIQNETADRLEGYIADGNGTRLEMYDGEQSVMVRFAYDDGLANEWETAGWIHDGYFVIEIPETYRDADQVRMYIGNHQYTVDDGTAYTRQTFVSINSARVDYRTNPDLDLETLAAEAEPTSGAWSKSSRGSLIDLMLRMLGLKGLPV